MVEEILPALFRVVVPLPGSPLKEVNSWIFTSDARNLVVDTGMNRPECREALEAGFAEIGLDLARTDFLSTHFHADHQGLIPLLLAEGGQAFMGEVDVRWLQVDFDQVSRRELIGDYSMQSGFPAAELDALTKEHPAFKYGPEARIDFVPVAEGHVFEVGDYRLKVITTPGHTPGHVCLYDVRRRLLVSGDHVLGDITPNIQVWSREDDSLAQYLRSLRKVAALEADLCLPGHRRVVENLPRRIEELIEHHHERADEVVSILAAGELTAYEIAAQMSWDIRARCWEEFPLMQRWFATGEALAHIRYLEGCGRVRRRECDDKVLYARIDSASRAPLAV